MTTAPGKARSKAKQRQSDDRLIADCIKGKESAWADLIDKYKNLIFSIPIRYGFSQEDSADIFQAVCMDLLAELPRLRDHKALAGWLIQVARNKCFHRKQSLLRTKVQEIDDVEEPADTPGELESLFSRLEQGQLLRDALTGLPPQCQALIRMLFFENPPQPYEEVARKLSLARGSIGFTRRNCLDKLKERLESLGI